MAELSRECERIARGWLVETQGNPETGALRHAIRLLLEEAEAEVERLKAELNAAEAVFRLSKEAEEALRHFQRAMRERRNKCVTLNELIVEMVAECEVQVGFRENPVRR